MVGPGSLQVGDVMAAVLQQDMAEHVVFIALFVDVSVVPDAVEGSLHFLQHVDFLLALVVLECLIEIESAVALNCLYEEGASLVSELIASSIATLAGRADIGNG